MAEKFNEHDLRELRASVADEKRKALEWMRHARRDEKSTAEITAFKIALTRVDAQKFLRVILDSPSMCDLMTRLANLQLMELELELQVTLP